MATTCSCSHWWHAPIYLIVSIFLAFVAISSFQPPPSTTTTTTTLDSLTQPLFSSNATIALRSNGFSIMATLLQFSPQLFFASSSSSQPSATVFAIKDTAFSNISTSPYAMQLLLQYHTLPNKLTFQELLTKSNYSCLPALVPSKNLSLTKYYNDHIMINNVTVSHPDLFLDDYISIHGVISPFTSLVHHNYNNTLTKLDDFVIKSPYCDDSFVISNKTHKIHHSTKISQHSMEWVRMIRALSSSGFVSFAIGLNSVHDRVLEEYPNLGSVTILAPLDFGFVGSSNWLLVRVVRYHIISQRYNYSELAALPAKTTLPTLLVGNVVEVTVNANVSHGVAVNGVDVVLSEIFSSRMFVVLGISRAMDFLDRAST